MCPNLIALCNRQHIINHLIFSVSLRFWSRHCSIDRPLLFQYFVYPKIKSCRESLEEERLVSFLKSEFLVALTYVS